jgi:D-tyrosyl-tRNA(Tyr) deacylase
MRVLLQRVSSASVAVGGACIAKISRGLLVFVGFFPQDTDAEICWIADKLIGMRIFPGANKPMNVSVGDVGGEILIVSQFTLAADTAHGKRPGFSSAAAPDQAEALYRRFVAAVRERYPEVSTGEFGADMQVSLINDGPVTFVLER